MRKLLLVSAATALVLGFAATPLDAHPGSFGYRAKIQYKEKVKKSGSFKAKGEQTDGFGSTVAGDGPEFPGWVFLDFSGVEMFERGAEEPSIVVADESEAEFPLNGFDGTQLKSKSRCNGEDCGESLLNLVQGFRPAFPAKRLGADDLSPIIVEFDSLRVRGSLKSKLKNSTTRGRFTLKFKGTVSGGDDDGKAVKGVIKVRMDGDFGGQ